jgi:hypothetical protein
LASGALDLAVAFVLGALVGAAEIVSRYRDNPREALWSWAAFLYVALNGTASLVALALLWVFSVTFGLTDDTQLQWTRVLAAGVSAMTLFRTALFFVKVGNQEIGIGPAGFIQILLAATDRSIDRRLGKQRLKIVGPIMDGLTLPVTEVSLPLVCLASQQNLSAADQNQLASDIASVKNSAAADNAKVDAIGLKLLNFFGEDVLRAAVARVRGIDSTLELLAAATVASQKSK